MIPKDMPYISQDYGDSAKCACCGGYVIVSDYGATVYAHDVLDCAEVIGVAAVREFLTRQNS